MQEKKLINDKKDNSITKKEYINNKLELKKFSEEIIND